MKQLLLTFALALQLLSAGCATPLPPTVVECPKPPPIPAIKTLPKPGETLRRVEQALQDSGLSLSSEKTTPVN